MKIFAWHTRAIKGYRPGSVAVIAETAVEARWKIVMDFERWIRSGFADHSPLAHLYDGCIVVHGYPAGADVYDIEQIDEERAEALDQLINDISCEPITVGENGVFYQWGGD